MRIALIVLGVLAVLLVGAALWFYTPDQRRAALETRYAAPPSRFLDVLGVRLHVRDTGPREAPALLLLHGFGSSLHTWDDWAPLLDDTFRLIRIDLPGFGLTGADPSGDYTDARTHALLGALLDQLGLQRTHLLGSSMGGRIAWTFASAHPERVDRLILMAPDGFASPGRPYGETPRVPWVARLLPYTLPSFLLRASLRPAYADPAAMTPERAERYRAMLLAPGVRQAILDRIAQHVLTDPAPLLARIAAPTLLLWGETDRMVPARHAEDYQRLLRDHRTVVLPNVGHVPMEEAPQASAAAVRDFLSAAEES